MARSTNDKDIYSFIVFWFIVIVMYFKGLIGAQVPLGHEADLAIINSKRSG